MKRIIHELVIVASIVVLLAVASVSGYYEAVFAQTETLPEITPIYGATILYTDGVPVVDWRYPLKESLPPPSLSPDTITAWVGDSAGTAAAVIEAATLFQKGVDDTYAANNIGPAPNIFTQIEAHVRSKELEEAYHYVQARAEQLGVSTTTDPKFYAALDTIRNRW